MSCVSQQIIDLSFSLSSFKRLNGKKRFHKGPYGSETLWWKLEREKQPVTMRKLNTTSIPRWCKNIAIFRVELFPRTVFEHLFCLFDRILNVPRLGQPESLSNGPSMNWALIL
jgi:hypothetical protein